MQGLLSLEVDSGAVAWVLEYLRALRHGRLLPYNYVERKTRLATRGSTTWGPTGEQLRELAAASHQSECLDALFAVLSQRLGARTSSSWRKVYKSLLVLEFLVTRGSQAAAMRGKDVRHLVRDLCDFEFTDPGTGKDEVRLCCCAVCSKRERLTHVPTHRVSTSASGPRKSTRCSLTTPDCGQSVRRKGSSTGVCFRRAHSTAAGPESGCHPPSLGV